MAKSYIDHNFPVILHTAKPVRLDETLKNNLDIFIPKAKSLLENIINETGRNKKDFIFFRAHHLAIAILPDHVIFCLDSRHATLFLSAIYCFELNIAFNEAVIRDVLKTNFDLCHPILFVAPKRFVEQPDSITFDQLRNLMNGWITQEERLIDMNRNTVTLTPKVFKNTLVPIKPGYCFVLMPFSQELTEVYEDCIKVSIIKSGMECKRADDIFHNSSIMEVVWTEICSSEIIVADLTGKNPNVFYELGIAHTLGKETIMITQHAEDVPFDLRHLRYIKYKNTGRGLQELEQQIALTIQSIRKGDDKIAAHD